MTRIAVSDNMIVDYSEDRWRLIRLAVDAPPTLLIEVKAGKSFRYDDYFGTTRALPPMGEVATGDIGEVVLGWSDESGAWQLGMTLALELSLVPVEPLVRGAAARRPRSYACASKLPCRSVKLWRRCWTNPLWHQRR